MGMPASAALLLRALTEEDDKWLHFQAKELFSRFSLFAIILTDPVKDPSFYKYVQENFSFFDRLTGSNFLFFSIVKEANLKKYQSEWKFRAFHDINAYKQNNAAENVIHSEFAIHALCSILGIDYDDTPTLIVSNTLPFGQICKIDTCTAGLEKQLKELSRIGDYLKNKISTVPLYDLIVESNKLGQFAENVELLDCDMGVLKNVSSVLQAVSVEGIFNDYTLGRLKNQLYKNSNYIGHGSLSEERILETLCLVQGVEKNLKKHLQQSTLLFQRSLSIPESIQKKWKSIQYTTNNYLKAAAFVSNKMSMFLREIDDYSMYTFPLCKSFETEINLSVVQLIRKELGVLMPIYFSKYCSEKDDLPYLPSKEIVQTPRIIYMNNKSRGKWLPPGLGESRVVFESMRLRDPLVGIDWETDDRLTVLTKNWGAIQKIRNLTMHNEAVNKSYVEVLDSCFSELDDLGLLNSLTDLKVTLSH